MGRGLGFWLLLATSAFACDFAPLSPIQLAQKSLTLIGSDHSSDVFAKTTRLLEAEKPDAVSLEQYISPSNAGVRFDQTQTNRWKAELMSGKAKYSVEEKGESVVIKMGDLTIFNGLGRMSEANAGILYALKHDKPFYFTDWAHEFPDIHFGFINGTIVPVPLVGKTTYQNHPTEFDRYQGRVSINVMNVTARSRYAADGIRELYRQHAHVAHIGGIYHFTARHPWEISMQSMLPTGKQSVHFLAEPDYW